MVISSPESSQGRTPNGFLRGFRHVFDPMLCLLIAVLLVRTFLVQGYLISTGSMAPHYYGRQKLATCAKCGYRFAVGTEFDEQPSLASIGASDWAVCPNCLSDDAELSGRPVNRGDHLLVWKNAYAFRKPRRWEVVVFQNPNEPLHTYLKRVAGLPGEQIELRGGNVWIDGEIARKPLPIQRALRIPVFDSTFPPRDDDTWTPRWSPRRGESGWSRTETGWSYRPPESEQPAGDWLGYRHTLRFGGDHKTAVALKEPVSPTVLEAFQEKSASFPFSPEPAFPGLHYDEASNRLIATGVIPENIVEKLRPLDPSPAFQAAVDEIIEKSRLAPVSDFYAYNHQSVRVRQHPVSEFLLEVLIRPEGNPGTIAAVLSTPGGEYRCLLDLKRSRIRLVGSGSGESLREASFRPADANRFLLEFSSFDRQISVGIDGVEPFEPWELAPQPDDRPMPSHIAGLTGTMPFAAASVKLYRDVYYTNEPGDLGFREPYVIPNGEYFVLGDNSPVSSDSRRWEIPTVPRGLLVGKPFLVHLPSTQEKLVWRGREFRYRRPDFSRIRFVR